MPFWFGEIQVGAFTGEKLVCVRGERTVFTDLDFRVESGGALILIGPNGSGKSSLLRLMATLLKPYSGTLAWDGEDVREDPEAHGARIHYVGHHDAVKPVLTVRENVAFWASLRGHDDKVDAALDTWGIKHLADVPGRFLSAGQKRRVNLSRILAAPAPVWLLDEPTTALDKATIAQLEKTMAEHRAGGGIIVLSTHAEILLEDPQVLELAHFNPRFKGEAA